MRLEAKGVGGVLGRRGLAEGRYSGEEPDAMEWLSREANDVYDAITEGRDPGDVLIDTGWWVPEDEGPFPADLRAELEAAAWA